MTLGAAGHKYGLIIEEPKAEDYIFGASPVPVDILQPDGQWDAYLPTEEFQNLYGVEPYACASFGTLNCIETILRRRFGFIDNFSDRHLAKISGTEFKKGNSPHTVSEFIRKSGIVDEPLWPITPDVDSFEKFYAPIAIKDVDHIAQRFVKGYDFLHEYVQTDPASLKTALKSSPIGLSVTAWVQDDGTGYYKAGAGQDNHWVMLYGYEDGKCWHVFDSYDNSHKKLEWKHRAVMAKRYHIDLAPQTFSYFAKALAIIKAFLAQYTPAPTPLPTSPHASRITDFALAIKSYEDYVAPGSKFRDGTISAYGSRSWRNKNPGNARYSKVGYASVYGFVGQDVNGFAIFKDYATGFLYLQNLLKTKIKAHPDWDILRFFADENFGVLFREFGYAPASDGNVPKNYAQYVANFLKIPITTLVRDLL